MWKFVYSYNQIYLRIDGKLNNYCWAVRAEQLGNWRINLENVPEIWWDSGIVLGCKEDVEHMILWKAKKFNVI